MIALWVIARQMEVPLPRRLVYVVDRRAVVDQATEFVNNLVSKLPADDKISVSTLRGQYADNRDWLEDPSKPAIIVGTVDMVGSRLLFEGYGVSRKMRSYHAGFLGADSLIVLDESHLVPPFEHLLEDISDSKVEELGAAEENDQQLIPKLRLLPLSATGRERSGEYFRLEDGDFEGDSETAKITHKRLYACKNLKICSIGGRKMSDALADETWKLVKKESQEPARYLIYCNSRDDAEKTKKAIEQKAKANRKENIDKTNINGPELFIGARRNEERERAKRDLEGLGFLAGSEQQNKPPHRKRTEYQYKLNFSLAASGGELTPKRLDRPAFLIATSAGEVGVDLNADHMICDLVAWERMVQRLGRVNRRGNGNARIVVVNDEPKPKKPDNPTEKEKTDLEKRRFYLLPLQKLPQKGDGSHDASPKALLDLKTELKEAIKAATTPEPLRPALNRPLLDAWSMTSLKTHTGRPEVAPWLRGWTDDEPQTIVVWRKHLPVPIPLPSNDKAQSIWHKSIEGYFEAAPAHISEQLETETRRVTEWLLARAKNYGEGSEKPSQMVIAILLNRSGDYGKHYTLKGLKDITDEKKSTGEKGAMKRQLARDISGKMLMVSAEIGGLSEDGTLNKDTNEKPTWLADDRDEAEQAIIPWRCLVRDDSEDDGESEPEDGGQQRFEYVIKRNSEGEPTKRLLIYKTDHQDTANEDDRSLMSNPQTLSEHHSWTAERAHEIAKRLELPEPCIRLLKLAARLHDEGKQAEIWQRAFNAPPDGRIYAKTRGPISQRLLSGYRHEFGSLFYAEGDDEFQKLNDEEKDLALHLIAAHHGYARPVISTAGCEQAPPSKLKERAADVALRFARLQRRWGPWGLAWWESLLRAADQLASKDNEEGRN